MVSGIAFLALLFSNLLFSFLSHVESPFSFPLTWLSLLWGELNLGGRHDPVCDLTEQAVERWYPAKALSKSQAQGDSHALTSGAL